MQETILVLNAGSSSIKFALYPRLGSDAPELSGAIDRIGPTAELTVRNVKGAKTASKVETPDHGAALTVLARVIAAHFPDVRVTQIGHRMVHGGTEFEEPVIVTQKVLSALKALEPLAPLHLPHGIRGIEEAGRLYPEAQQVACFDTAFHAAKPWLNTTYGLDRSFYDEGIRRYGFHGLSCQSIVRQLRAEGFPLQDRRLVIAHLGNGCSATAVVNGVGYATSMGFSTLDGLLMGTRCGAIDPGVLIYWLRQGKDVSEIEAILYGQSGLMGVSGVSNDMRDLQASDDPRAAEAVDLFVMRLVEEIGRLAATMGGLETVVFCGGIGENAADIRDRVSAALGFLGSGGPEILVRETQEEKEIMLAVRAV